MNEHVLAALIEEAVVRIGPENSERRAAQLRQCARRAVEREALDRRVKIKCGLDSKTVDPLSTGMKLDRGRRVRGHNRRHLRQYSGCLVDAEHMKRVIQG